MARVFVTLAALCALLLAARVGPAAAQERRAAVGAVVGAGGGAVITLSAIVARARFQQRYVDSADDLVHWQSIPMIAAPAAGILFGYAGHDAHVGSIVGSTSGMVVGALIGSSVGWAVSRQPESPWAGGVIGAGVGLALGGLAGGIIAWSRDDDAEIGFPDALRFSFSVPAP